MLAATCGRTASHAHSRTPKCGSSASGRMRDNRSSREMPGVRPTTYAAQPRTVSLGLCESFLRSFGLEWSSRHCALAPIRRVMPSARINRSKAFRPNAGSHGLHQLLEIDGQAFDQVSGRHGAVVQPDQNVLGMAEMRAAGPAFGMTLPLVRRPHDDRKSTRRVRCGVVPDHRDLVRQQAEKPSATPGPSGVGVAFEGANADPVNGLPLARRPEEWPAKNQRNLASTSCSAFALAQSSSIRRERPNCQKNVPIATAATSRKTGSTNQAGATPPAFAMKTGRPCEYIRRPHQARGVTVPRTASRSTSSTPRS